MSGSGSKDRGHFQHHAPKNKNEIGTQQIDTNHDQNQMGDGMENGKRKCKTTTQYESIPRHHNRTQTIWKAETKASGNTFTITHRTLSFKPISTPI